jgi:L-fucose mutarotase
MLKGIDPILSPDILHALASMGHGDTLVVADNNFPAATVARRLCRLPGIPGPRVLEAVLTVFPLDTFVERPAAVMQVVGDPAAIPPPVKDYQELLNKAEGRAIALELVERHAFYERAKQAFAVIATGENRAYGNIILTKGTVRP